MTPRRVPRDHGMRSESERWREHAAKKAALGLTDL
jgi:hypothetical protein